MKKILKKSLCILLAFVLLIPIYYSINGIDKVNATQQLELNITESILDLGGSLSLQVLKTVNKKVTWESENDKVAIVNSEGEVTAIGKGITKIIAKVKGVNSSNQNQLVCEVGVKTAEYIPQTPQNFSYLVGKDIDAGQYVVFSNNTSPLGAFWEINNYRGNKTIENEFTTGASIIKVERSQSLVIHKGYAVPISKVSASVLRLYNLNHGILELNRNKV